MKAIAKTRPELGVEIIDAPMPRPGPDQILVRVAACGICGSDLHRRHAISLVSSGAVKLKPIVTHRYNIEGGIEAFELLRAKQGLKALIMPQGV